MAKKVLKQSTSEISSRKNISRVSFERALKNAIRRRSLEIETTIFDDAIPENFRTISTNTAQNPLVHLQESAALSPFILELRQAVPLPEAILAEEAYEEIRLNFLTEGMKQDHPTIMDTSHDLELSREDLEGQLNRHTRETILSHSLPAARKEASHRWFARNWMTRPKVHPEMMPLQIQKTEAVSFNAFEPKQLPIDILTYFDLPEEESATEEDSENLVELSDLFDVSEIPEIESDEQPKRAWIPSFDFFFMPNGWQRSIAVFVLLSFLFVLPIHAMQVLNQLRDAKSGAEANGLQALQSLKDATGTNLVQNPNEARTHFNAASTEFGKAKENIDALGTGITLLLSNLAPTQASFKTNTALLTIGTELSIAGSRISEGFDALQQEIHPTPSSKLELLHLYLESALPHLITAQAAMQEIDENTINEDQRETYEKLVSTLPSLVASTKDFLSLSDALKLILGTDQTKHYLLIFQNNTEIRPTGGFMGSFAEMTVHNGVMEKLNIPGGGTYDLQGQQKQSFVSPWPLQLLSAKWEFQDANWFPDFRTSARHIISFYKNARGSAVDGVIAINANYVQDLIGLLGPVEMPEYGRVIDEQNFFAETQKIVELEYDKTENKPKEFIGDLAPKLIEKALHQSPDTFLTLADQLNKGLARKEIQLYFTDETVEKTVLERGWGGEIKATDKDYLMLVNTNLGGGKTDSVIKEHMDVDVQIAKDGVITNKVTITRTHHGDPLDLFMGANNVNYQRLYVPKGSTLLSATGFTIPSGNLFETPEEDWIVDPDLQFADESFTIHEQSGTQIYEEDGKTVFGNWTQTKPGATTTTTYTYTLPFTFSKLLDKRTRAEQFQKWVGMRETDSYSLLLQKQSGIVSRGVTVKLHLPDELNLLWSSSDLLHTEFKNTQDNFFSALFEPSI